MCRNLIWLWKSALNRSHFTQIVKIAATASINLEHIYKISKALGVDIKEIFEL